MMCKQLCNYKNKSMCVWLDAYEIRMLDSFLLINESIDVYV